MPNWKKLIVSGSDAAIPSVSNTGDFTIDAGGDIVLDADGADVLLKDNGTTFGRFRRDTSNLVIKSETSNKDMLFKGNMVISFACFGYGTHLISTAPKTKK